MNTPSDQTTRRPCVLVIGVGATRGIGGAVSRRIADSGLHVYVVGRTQDKIDQVVTEIIQLGGHATAYRADVTKPDQVETLITDLSQRHTLELVVHNVGSNMPSRFLQTKAGFFEQMWRLTFLSGRMVAELVLPLMQAEGHGTLIFTGASASLRGKPLFAAFTSGKASLRAYALHMAEQVRPHGVHVAHVVIDGMVDGDRINQFGYGAGRLLRMGMKGLDGSLNVDHIADQYWQLHSQPAGAWTHEMDLRPYREKF